LERVDLQQLLCIKPESVCQDVLDKVLVEEMKVAVKTSESSCRYFTAARSVGDTVAVSVLSAKPDLTDKLCPQLIEIKQSKNPCVSSSLMTSDTELLVQMMVRVSTIVYTNGLLNNFTVLGATDRSAWVVQFIRDIYSFNKKDGDIFEKIEIRRINHCDLLKIYMSNYSFSISHKNWFFTRDATQLINTISRISYPFLCSVRLIDSSECRVYSVALPRIYNEILANGSTRRVVGPAASQLDFVIKVITDELKYQL
jgi:hypothetical protein